MRRFLRIVFNALTVLSLFLAVGVGFVLRRSQGRFEELKHQPKFETTVDGGRIYRDQRFVLCNGRLYAKWNIDVRPPSPAFRITLPGPPEWSYQSSFAGPGSFWWIREPYGYRYKPSAAKQRGVGLVSYSLNFPLWPFIAIFAILPCRFAFQLLRQRLRRDPSKCRSCNYDLRATPDRCPECGAVVAKV